MDNSADPCAPFDDLRPLPAVHALLQAAGQTWADLNTAAAAHCVRRTFPSADSLTVNMRRWFDRDGGIDVLAIHDSDGHLLWNHGLAESEGLQPAALAPAEHAAWDNTRGEVEHLLAAALEFCSPNNIGWRLLFGDTDEDTDHYLLDLPAAPSEPTHDEDDAVIDRLGALPLSMRPAGLRPGDQFRLTSGSAVYTVAHPAVPSPHGDDAVLILWICEQPWPLTLPRESAYELVSAVREGTVRCALCQRIESVTYNAARVHGVLAAVCGPCDAVVTARLDIRRAHD